MRRIMGRKCDSFVTRVIVFSDLVGDLVGAAVNAADQPEGQFNSEFSEFKYSCGFALLQAAAIARKNNTKSCFSAGVALDLQDCTVFDRHLLHDRKTQSSAGYLGTVAHRSIVTFGNPRHVLRFDPKALVGD